MSLRVLLADDSMTAQNMGKKILSDAGFDVTAVSNGAAALKKLAEVQPDVVILDIYMPGYSGLEVCERIRVNDLKLPVLLTVGKLEPYRAEDGTRVQANGVIVKPFEASDLIATVNRLGERATKAAAAAAPAAPVVPTSVAAPEVPAPAAPVFEQLQPGDMEFLQDAAPEKTPEAPHGATVDYFAHDPVTTTAPEPAPFVVEAEAAPVVIAPESDLPSVTDEDFAMLKQDEPVPPANVSPAENSLVENTPFVSEAEVPAQKVADELPAFDLSPASEEFSTLDLPAFDLNEVPPSESLADSVLESPVIPAPQFPDIAPASEQPATSIEDFDLPPAPAYVAEPEAAPEPKTQNYSSSAVPELNDPELLVVEEPAANEPLELQSAVEQVEDLDVIVPPEPEVIAPAATFDSAVSLVEEPELLSEEFAPEASSAFALQDPLLVPPDDFTTSALLESVEEKPLEVQSAESASAPVEPINIEPITLDAPEPQLLDIPEPPELVATSAGEPMIEPISPSAAPLNYGRIAGAVQRVFDRYKPQIIAEIVRELTANEEK